jgi:hypothetical protein
VTRSRIAAIPAFADLPEPELDELGAAVHELAVAEGSTVVAVDDYGDAIYMVEEGTADVVNERGETTETTQRRRHVRRDRSAPDGSAHGDRRRAHATPAPLALRPPLRAHPTARP